MNNQTDRMLVGNTFVAKGTLFTGSYTVKNEPGMNCHRVRALDLEPGATYSYRLGGNGFYTYGRFTVSAEPRAVRIVNFSDTQTKGAPGLYKTENAVAAAVRTAGGAKNVDLVPMDIRGCLQPESAGK